MICLGLRARYSRINLSIRAPDRSRGRPWGLWKVASGSFASKRMAAGKNIDFTHPIHDERERTAQEGPAHGLGDGRISLREANSS